MCPLHRPGPHVAHVSTTGTLSHGELTLLQYMKPYTQLTGGRGPVEPQASSSLVPCVEAAWPTLARSDMQ